MQCEIGRCVVVFFRMRTYATTNVFVFVITSRVYVARNAPASFSALMMGVFIRFYVPFAYADGDTMIIARIIAHQLDHASHHRSSCVLFGVSCLMLMWLYALSFFGYVTSNYNTCCKYIIIFNGLT